MKYAFGSGDDGKTRVYSGRIPKTDPLIKAIGDVDELSAHIGHAISCSSDNNTIKTLKEIEYDLYVIGAELAGYGGAASERISAEDVRRLDDRISKYSKNLSEIRGFIYPNGSLAATEINICRAISRRTEINILETGKADDDLKSYINRLSSLLFVMFRYTNKKSGSREEKYK